MKADKALIEENPEDLYENAPCGYISFLEDGTIIKVNRTLLDWLGFERDELLGGRNFQSLLSIGGQIFFETHIGPLLKMQSFAKEISFDMVCKNKQKIPVLTSTTQRRMTDQDVVVYRATVLNITERRSYERELRLERDKARQAAAMKANFLSMMSHEIRTPMNAVVGITHLLERTHLSEQQAEYIEMLKSSADNLMGLLNNILDLGKLESGKVEFEERVFNLKELAETSAKALEGQAREKNLSLRVTLAHDLPDFLIGDPFKIRQVLTNLIGNAIKFTDAGVVNLKLSVQGISETSASIFFQVIDTGIGVSPDRLPFIFDEFTQAGPEIGMKHGGSGLGLSISGKLIEMLGSKISVESELGKGSIFSFSLHLKIGSPAQSQLPTVERQGSGALNGIRVLVAEDDPINALILKRMLKRWGLLFEIVSNGLDALDRLRQSTFDIVLMDLSMPIMDGYEAVKEIRESSDEGLCTIPVIAFSASAESGEEDAIEAAGFDSSIGKPFEPEDLFRKIELYARQS